MKLIISEDGKTLVNLDEVRFIIGSKILFKGETKLYDIGEEAADAIRQRLTHRHELLTELRDTLTGSSASDLASCLPERPDSQE